MNLTYEQLTAQTRAKLEELTYSADTIRHYQSEWDKFSVYMEEHDITEVSNETVSNYFMQTYGVAIDSPAKDHTRTMRMTIRALITLVEFQESGIIYRRRLAKTHEWPVCFKEPVEAFLALVAESHSKTTFRQCRSKLEAFVQFLLDNGCEDFNTLTPELISNFMKSRECLAKTTRRNDSYFLRKLFDFLYDTSRCVIDYSVFVPKVKVNSRGGIPSFYTADDLTKLLSMIDRSNPLGKRDYAIMLVAMSYGIRIGDIRDLKLSDFDWPNSKLSFVASKTGKRMTFPLLPEVATAIIDYLKNGRPETSCKNVFIRHIAPYTAFGKDNNLHNIISKYMNMAGFTDFHHRKHGFHSFRQSIAGNMLASGVPMPTVSEILGHSSTETTMIYTKIDIGQLTRCALEVE